MPYHEENNWFYFHGTFNFDGIQFTLAEFSYPIKLMTNSDQKAVCMGTLLFDIAAGRFGVQSVLENPRPKICWYDFESAFLVWFKGMTGRKLDPIEFETIQKKFLRPDYFEKIRVNSMTEFSLEQLQDEIHGNDPDNYSFADWLYSMTVFIKKHLGPQSVKRSNGIITRRGVWENRVFEGLFMDGNSDLYTCGDGAYFVRFSYTVTDAITIDFVLKEIVYSHRCTSDELKNRSLVDLIRDVPVWETLYPGGKSKDFLDQFTLPADPAIKIEAPYIKALTEIMKKLKELSVSQSPSTSLQNQNPLTVFAN